MARMQDPVWTLGTPPATRELSMLVEVTDGDRFGLAQYRRPLPSAEIPGAWLNEDGLNLGWEPTHWRIVAGRHTYDLEGSGSV